MLRNIKKLSLAVAGMALLGLGSSAPAALVTLGPLTSGSYGAGTTVALSSLYLVTSISGNYTTVSGAETGTITEGVYSTGSGDTGTLDFAYQFNLNIPPGGDVRSFSAGDFLLPSVVSGGLASGTDAVFKTPTLGNGPGDSSGTIAEGSDGAITWDFAAFDVPSASPSPEYSSVFIVATNSTIYGGGFGGLQDNENSNNVSLYAPAPLPASAGTAAALLGCVGAFSVIRRRVMA